MSKQIRWGLLSTANINRAVLDPIRQATRSELVAVASRSQEKADAYAKGQNIPKAHGSYEALLADPDVDVIYNPLPNSMHCEWTVKAAEAGKHVLCEKPLVTNLEDLDKIEAATTANNVTIFEAFMYLHHPQTRKALEMIQEGQLGELQQIQSWFQFYLPPERVGNIRLSVPLEGGAMWDVGVYPNSVAITMAQAGAPAEVWGNQIIGETGVDVAMRGQMRFANGVIAQISTSFRTPFREGVQLLGDKGALEIPHPWKPGVGEAESQMIFTTHDGKTETIVTPGIDAYLCEVQAMEACILDGADPVVPLSLSRDFLRSALALRQSAESGKLVALSTEKS